MQRQEILTVLRKLRKSEQLPQEGTVSVFLNGRRQITVKCTEEGYRVRESRIRLIPARFFPLAEVEEESI